MCSCPVSKRPRTKINIKKASNTQPRYQRFRSAVTFHADSGASCRVHFLVPFKESRELLNIYTIQSLSCGASALPIRWAPISTPVTAPSATYCTYTTLYMAARVRPYPTSLYLSFVKTNSFRRLLLNSLKTAMEIFTIVGLTIACSDRVYFTIRRHFKAQRFPVTGIHSVFLFINFRHSTPDLY